MKQRLSPNELAELIELETLPDADLLDFLDLADDANNERRIKHKIKKLQLLAMAQELYYPVTQSNLEW
jgi:hypothetical protein